MAYGRAYGVWPYWTLMGREKEDTLNTRLKPTITSHVETQPKVHVSCPLLRHARGLKVPPSS